MQPQPLTRAEAIRRLTNRWNQEAERYPTMRNDIPLKLYLSANLRQVLRDRVQLADYR